APAKQIRFEALDRAGLAMMARPEAVDEQHHVTPAVQLTRPGGQHRRDDASRCEEATAAVQPDDCRMSTFARRPEQVPIEGRRRLPGPLSSSDGKCTISCATAALHQANTAGSAANASPRPKVAATF